MSSNITLYNNTNWEEEFPKTEYERYENRERFDDRARFFYLNRHWLKWMIVWCDDDTKVSKSIEKLRGRLKFQALGPMSPLGLTALHVAVLKGRATVLRTLLECGASPNRTDNQGWTPYHLSVFQSSAISRLLRSYGASKTIETPQGWCFQDLLALTGRAPINSSSQEVLVEGKFGSQKGLECQVMKKFTGRGDFCYSDLSWHPAVDWKAVWQQEDSEPLPGAVDDLAKFSTPYHKADPVNPKLSLRQNKGDVSIHSREFLANGRYLANFSGVFAPDGSELDQTRWANWTRFITDGGLPNCDIVKLPTEHVALPKWIVVATSKAVGISYGHRLFTDRGDSSLSEKWGSYVLRQNPVEIRRYYSHCRPKDLLKLCESKRQEVFSLKETSGPCVAELVAHLRGLRQRAVWPINTPAVMIDLACSGAVEPREWRPVLLSDAVASRRIQSKVHLKRMGHLIDLLDRFCDLADYSPVGIKMRAWVLSKIGKMSVTELAQAIHGMTTRFHALPRSYHEELWLGVLREIKKESKESYCILDDGEIVDDTLLSENLQLGDIQLSSAGSSSDAASSSTLWEVQE